MLAPALLAPALLALLAIALAWPVPLLLSGARWTRRSPAAALVLWQAIAIAGGLSMIGALLTFGLAPYGDNLFTGAVGFVTEFTHPQPVEILNVLALAGAGILTAHLVLNLVITVVRSERQRRRHANLLLLLSSPHPSGSRLIDTPAPVAYCLPGALSSVTVVSAGLVELLDDEGMRAVIEHERAHVRQRHDIVLVLFRAWQASLPWFPIAYRAQREVGILIEMLADDDARRIVDDAVLADTIARVGAGRTVADVGSETWPDESTTDALSDRVQRLAPGARPLPRGAEAGIVGAAVLLLAVPTVLLLYPALLSLLAHR